MENAINVIWNNNFYVLKGKSGIDIYNDNKKFLQNIFTQKEFVTLTYNEKEQVFYFVQDNNDKQIFTTSDFDSFIIINIPFPTGCHEKIINITYCSCQNSLLITTNTTIFIYDFCKKNLKILFKIKAELAKINDCMLELGCNRDNTKTLISAICCCKDIYVVYSQCGIYYISKLENGELSDPLYEIYYPILCVFIKNNELWLLINKCGKKEFVFTGICCQDECEHFLNCKCQIIESVASVEKSIAKILNSESLKIKAAINQAENTSDLICINSSVREVIYYITILEFILTEKLRVTIGKTECD